MFFIAQRGFARTSAGRREMLDDFREIMREGEPLAPYTWFQLGGTAEYFVEPRSVEELSGLLARCSEAGLQARILGGGSNLLVQDEGVRGVVICLSHPTFTATSVSEQKVRAGGGASLSRLVVNSVRDGLAGLEVLVGIPGTVGGAISGNAGGRDGDVAQWISKVVAVDMRGQVAEIGRAELDFGYRSSNLHDKIITYGEFDMQRGDAAELKRHFRHILNEKRNSQPLKEQSGGCVFKNVRGISTRNLIMRAGLTGSRIGGAEVSERHPNFIVAHPGATSDDVLRLIDYVTDKVRQRMQVELQLELKIW